MDDLEPLRNLMRNAGDSGYDLLKGDATPISRGWLRQVEEMYPSVREEAVSGDEYVDVSDGRDAYRLEIVHDSDDEVLVSVSEEAVVSGETTHASTDWGLKNLAESVLARDEDVPRNPGSLIPPEPDPNPVNYFVGDINEV